MAIIIILISISLVIAVAFLVTFLWNLKSGQYEDTYSPAVRMLFDGKVQHKTDKALRGSNGRQAGRFSKIK